ncbi:MAG: NAD-dependent epimerase/dehydratase family protein [Gammaproteobacteria bacterium]
MSATSNRISNNKEVGIVVTGATSLIGQFLLPQLRNEGYKIYALTRSEINRSKVKNTSNEWRHYDGSLKSITPKISNTNILIHLAPLYSLPDIIEELASLGGERIIAFSSTSRFSKINSPIASEQEVAQKLSSAEKSVTSICNDHQIESVIFRPTLIYGAGLDQNVSSVASFIQRFRCFPLVGKSTGLRQPVHAEDLAIACAKILNVKKIPNQFYNLVGGESLTYKKMIERIFLALNKKARFISFPLPLFKVLIKCISIIPAYSHLTTEMADRINRDLCFDSTEAINDFGYKPREFYPKKEDLIKKSSNANF